MKTRLHIFNPSHDEALAADSPYYYPASAARRLESELAALPALMAEPGDSVLLCESAAEPDRAGWNDGVRFVRPKDLTPAFWENVTEVLPWGWDKLLCHRLQKAGCPGRLLLDAERLAAVRRLSSRESAVVLLPRLRERLDGTVGESVLCRSAEKVRGAVARWGAAMVKSLWSCSGRGVYRADGQSGAAVSNRTERLLRAQGAVECEPFYEVALNFAMEFSAQSGGGVRYDGLSLFRASEAGAYGGNVVAPQERLAQAIVDAGGPDAQTLSHIARVCAGELETLLGGAYAGPLGVDMMLVRTAGGTLVLHPCVELNLRRTMGHAALAMAGKVANMQSLSGALGKMWYICP